MRRAWAWIAVVVTILLNIGVMIEYTDYVNTKNEHAWCAVIDTLDDAYHVQPPASPTGKRLADAIHKQRGEFGC